MEAIAYIRKSNTPDESSHSIEDQREWAWTTAKRRGFTLREDDIYEEVVSGWQQYRARPQREALVTAIRSGSVRVLMVRVLDRLGRNQAEVSAIVEECRRKRMLIVTEAVDHDTTTAESVLLTSTLSALAQAEASRTSERLRATAAALRQRGGWNGIAPYGWEKAPRGEDGVIRLRLHPEQTKLVRRMVDEVLGGAGIAQVVESLSHDGCITAAGKPWSYKSVVRVLRHPILAGYQSLAARDEQGRQRPDARELVLDTTGQPLKAHSAVVTPEEYRALQILVAPKRLTSRRQSARGLPLAGLVYCEGCGRRMISSRRAGAYICDSKQRGIPCTGRAIRAASLLMFLETFTGAVLQSEEALEAQRAQFEAIHSEQTRENLEALRASIAQADEEIEVLSAMVADRTTPLEAYPGLMARLSAARADRDLAQNQQADLLPRGLPLQVDPLTYEEFQALPDETRQTMVRRIVERVEILPDPGHGGAQKGYFGSSGINLARVRFRAWGDDEGTWRQTEGFALTQDGGLFTCEQCDPIRSFAYRNNRDHHARYAHPRVVECELCGEMIPLPGMPSHKRKHARDALEQK
ncbi:recombinase family protein [Micrococcaceae sp. AOP34-BR2-30]|uniref:recombinase family protein n=1 Tax=Microbacteriaceae TaxID=85023 RepID=UPI00097EBD92|nr:MULTISPECIES: recombinase family protein [Microbacteriaceae]MDA3146006.1 recombinase family protein [Leucobacter sp. UCMA 4100]SJM52286.1 probable DNA invertase [Gulosibacter sp. 10]